MAVLSNIDIEDEMTKGNVIIEPFDSKQLGNASYDVRLGNTYYSSKDADPSVILNPWSKKHMTDYWGKPLKASLVTAKDKKILRMEVLTEYIQIAPGETILAHTEEFIGGRGNITTELYARSSLGRCGIEICKCAGWGDIGYVNRWTLEITNNSKCAVALPIGKRIGQIVFLRCGLPSFEYNGKYQGSLDVDELMKSWSPEQMLPKLYLENS